MDVEKLLLKPDEAAAMLGIGRSKIYALLADGSLPSIRLGRSIRIPAESLRQWVREKAEATSPATIGS